VEIEGYKYLAHKIVPRPWGIECRFTVDKNGLHFNDIVMLETGKEDEKEIAGIILKRMLVMDRPDAKQEPEKIYTETEIKTLLVDKGYLEKTQKIEELKTKAELIAAVEVKP
jgi:hypothetical protein